MQKFLATLLVILQLLPFAWRNIELSDVQRLLPLATQGAEQENAYLTVFKALTGGDTKYYAVNLANVKYVDAAKLFNVLREYGESQGFEVLPRDDDWLRENGYMKTAIYYGDDNEEYENEYFEDGLYVSIGDSKLTKNTLEAGGSFSNGETYGGGFDYTVRRFGCTWYIVDMNYLWIA